MEEDESTWHSLKSAIPHPTESFSLDELERNFVNTAPLRGAIEILTISSATEAARELPLDVDMRTRRNFGSFRSRIDVQHAGDIRAL